MGTALDTVNRFYDITNNRNGEGLPALVTRDITFQGPVMQASGAEEYLAMNAQLLPFHQGMRMMAQFEQGDQVCSIYEMDMSSPKGERLTVTLADWLRVENGRVAQQRIFFDPRAFTSAFGM